MGIPVIDLPQDSQKHVAYMTKLDSSSLKGKWRCVRRIGVCYTEQTSAAWNKFHVDILVQASPGASGSLIRLLKSLSAADYTSCAVPHLTIELAHDVDVPTREFLRSFQWPPAHVPNPTNVQQLSLRHRIAQWSLNEEDSSIRFLESFWPANPQDSHVLVLSPQTELSPQFYHCKSRIAASQMLQRLTRPDLRYSVLEYKYSSAALAQEWDARLMGISLDLPATHLDDTTRFTPPTKKNAQSDSPHAVDDTPSPSPQDGPTPFLWQAPSSNAILFSGTKWAELHGFVGRLLDTQHRLPASPASFLSAKSVSKRFPSWLEHALRLARARGYWTLYPGNNAAGQFATVHTELYHAPEEYEAEVPAAALSGEAAEGREKTLARELVLGGGEGGGKLFPPFRELPLLSWEGKAVALEELDREAARYTTEFREAVGGCEDLAASELLAKADAADLFCEREG